LQSSLPCGAYNFSIEIALDPFYTADLRFREDQVNVELVSVSDAIQLSAKPFVMQFASRYAASGLNDTALLDFGHVHVYPCEQRQLQRLRFLVSTVISHRALPDDRLFLRGRLYYTTLEGVREALPRWDAVDIVHPSLELVSWIEPYHTPVAAGNSLRLSVMVRHALDSTAAAFDVTLQDSSNVHFALDAESVTCALRCAVNVPHFTYNISADGRQQWQVAELLLGQELYQEWNVTVLQTVPTGLRLKNRFVATYDTHPRDPGAINRLGASVDVFGAPQPPLESQCTADVQAGAIVGGFQRSSLFNGVAAPSAGDTPALAWANRSTLVPDEWAEWAFDLSLPPSTAELQLIVNMPPPLRILRTLVLGVGSCINHTLAVIGSSQLGQISNDGGTVTFDLGPAVQRLEACAAPRVANASVVHGAAARPAEILSLRVRALVDPNAIVSDALRNQPHSIYARMLNNAQYQDVALTFLLREPRLRLEDPLAAGRVHDAADVTRYAVRVTHDSAASSTAFNMTLRYAVDARLRQLSATLFACLVPMSSILVLPLSNVSCSTVVGGRALSPFEIEATGFAFYVDELGVGEAILLSIEAQVVQNVFPQDILENRVTVLYDSSPAAAPLSGKAYSADVSFATIVRSPESSLVEVDSDDPYTAPLWPTLHESVTVNLTLQLPESVMPRARAILATPQHMDLLSVEIIHVGHKIEGSLLTSGSDAGVSVSSPADDATAENVVLECGSLLMRSDNVADLEDSIVVRIRLRMRVDKENDLGSTRPLRVEMTWDGSDVQRSYVRFHPLYIAEPLLQAHISQPALRLDARDVLSYSAYAEHTPTSNAAAYRVVAFISLPATLVLLRDTIRPHVCPFGKLSVPAIIVHSSETSFFVYADYLLHKMTVHDSVVKCLSVRYDARVVDTVRANEHFTSTIAVNWTSTPASSTWPGRQRVGDYDERDGRPLFVGARAAAGDVVEQHNVSMTLIATSLPDTPGSSVNVGEEAVFSICLALPESISNVTMDVYLPRDMTFINASVYRVGTSLLGGALFAGDMLANEGGEAAPHVAFHFGNVVNVPDNTATDGDRICVRLAGSVSDRWVFVGRQSLYVWRREKGKRLCTVIQRRS
jgi:hypothetical protein